MQSAEPVVIGHKQIAPPASLQNCENLIEMLLRRRRLSLPTRVRANSMRLLELRHPVTLPTTAAHAFLEPLIERAKAGVLAVSKTAAEGILRVDDELHLTPLEPLAEDPKVTKLRAALDRRVGEAQLPELILAVDAEVRFSWIMLGREPRSSKELLMVYAGILAHGTALSAA